MTTTNCKNPSHETDVKVYGACTMCPAVSPAFEAYYEQEAKDRHSAEYHDWCADNEIEPSDEAFEDYQGYLEGMLPDE